MTPKQFDCTICFESKSEDNPHNIGEEEYEVCLECAVKQVIPLFEKAVKHEFHYPPKFGSSIMIGILNFWDLLIPEFHDQYAAKEEEYSTKVSERIYRCHSIVPTEDDDAAPLNAMDVEGAEKSKLERWNAFLGRERNALDESDRIFCHRCTGMVCPCGEPLTDAGSKHECTALVESDAEAAFDSRTRRLWQMCQHGDLKIELSEACNEIHCLCGCKFCYLSGSNTDDQPAHFAPGGCPRWGNGDSPREQDFDQVVRAPGPYTVEQWNEAIRNAREDELAHPTHSLPEDPLANFDRNLHIILDRNDVRRLLDELRQDLDLDHEEDTVWRYETVLLLSTVEVCLDLLLSRVHAPSAEFADYARAFEGYQNTITEKLDLVPPEYINSQGNVFEIVPSAVAQM